MLHASLSADTWFPKEEILSVLSACAGERPCFCSGCIREGDIGHPTVDECTEFSHAHLMVRSERRTIIGPYECHGRAPPHVALQFFEQRAREAFSTLGLGNANRAI